MSISDNKTGMATYIAGAGTSAWIAGLANPVNGNPKIEICSNYVNPSDYRPTAPQEKRGFSPDRAPLNPNWGDPGWGE